MQTHWVIIESVHQLSWKIGAPAYLKGQVSRVCLMKLRAKVTIMAVKLVRTIIHPYKTIKIYKCPQKYQQRSIHENLCPLTEIIIRDQAAWKVEISIRIAVKDHKATRACNRMQVLILGTILEVKFEQMFNRYDKYRVLTINLIHTTFKNNRLCHKSRKLIINWIKKNYN